MSKLLVIQSQKFSCKLNSTRTLCLKKHSMADAAALKVIYAIFLLVCFVCLKEKTSETRKNVFYFTSKALFCYWDNQRLTFEILKRHETQNTFYCIKWEINTAWWWNLASLCNIPNKNLAWKLVPSRFCFSINLL